jgi:hypothetical protein
MHSASAGSYWNDRGLWLLWVTVLSGPAAWALNQLIGYALVKPVCAADAGAALLAVAIGTLAATVAGGWTAWTLLRRLRDANPNGGRVEDRSHMLAVGGVTLNALLGLLILTSSASLFLLSPCE